MKTFLIAILSLFLVATYLRQEPNQYVITGEIKNLPAKMVYLRIMKNDSIDRHAYWPKVDSAKVIDGKFKLSRDTSISIPTNSTISYIDTITKKVISLKFLNPTNGWKLDNFMIENAAINITGDNYNATGLSLSGSKETNFTNKYGRVHFLFAQIEINAKIDSLKKTSNTTKLNTTLKEKEVLIAKFKADFKQMIIENSSTYSVLKVLFQNVSAFNTKELDDLIALLDPKLMNTPLAKELLLWKSLKKD